jgi:hypothetical protein
MREYNPTRRFGVEQEPDGFGWNVIDTKHDKLIATFCTREQAFHRAGQLQAAFVESEYDRIAASA